MSRPWRDMKSMLARLAKPGTGPGELFDKNSYRGLMCFFLSGAFATWALWYLSELLCTGCTQRQIEWRQHWAWVIGGQSMVVSVLAAIHLAVKRYRIKKSRQAQWYDRADLTQADLYEDDPPEVAATPKRDA